MKNLNKKNRRLRTLPYWFFTISFFILFFIHTPVSFSYQNQIEVFSNPTLIDPGQQSSLSWKKPVTTHNCKISDSSIINPEITPDDPEIYLTPALTESKSYVVRCDSLLGRDFLGFADVNVKDKGFPTNFFGINTEKTLVNVNETTQIHWRAKIFKKSLIIPSGIDIHCNIEGPSGHSAVTIPINTTEGTFLTTPLVYNRTYTLTCSGPVNSFVGLNGIMTKNLTFTDSVTIETTLGGMTVVADPALITLGNSSYIRWTAPGAEGCFVNDPVQHLYLGSTGAHLVTPNFTTEYSINCYPSNTTKYVTIYVYDQNGNVLTKPTPGNNISNVFTDDATNVKDTEATLNGSLNPSGDGTLMTVKAYFRYSPVNIYPPVFCNEIYGSKMRATKEISVSGGNIQDVYTTVTDLSPNTKYYYCLFGSDNNEITSGNQVKSFMTLPKESDVSITTEDALVVNTVSAYLNGSYNAVMPTETWFEYKKMDTPNTTKGSENISFKEKVLNFLKIKEVLAATINPFDYSAWKGPFGKMTHSAETNGDISYLLEGLSPGTRYQFKTAIKTNSGVIKYGAIKTFTTKISGGSRPEDPFDNDPGVGYEDPCINIATPNDLNCDGSGGDVYQGRPTLNSLPDLTVGPVFPSSATINVPVLFSAIIRNQGRGSTANPNQIDIQNKSAPSGGVPVSFLKGILKTKKALAEKLLAENTFVPGSFYSFFQISTVDPTKIYYDIEKSAPSGGAPVSFLKKILKTNKARAQTSTADSITFINLPYILISPLGAKSSTTISQNYTFTYPGTFYLRACADKKSPADTGLIRESYENNNCGPWEKIVVSLYNTGTSNENQNEPTNYDNLVLGQTATPPTDAIVRYHEGIEHVFVRQIMANAELAESYGYQSGGNLQTFAWDLADILARTFGYVGSNGKEIRVSQPDIAAYQLYMRDGILTVYEYYDSVVVNIQRMTEALRNKYEYEYYFNK
jgi:hypothetical protein